MSDLRSAVILRTAIERANDLLYMLKLILPPESKAEKPTEARYIPNTRKCKHEWIAKLVKSEVTEFGDNCLTESKTEKYCQKCGVWMDKPQANECVHEWIDYNFQTLVDGERVMHCRYCGRAKPTPTEAKYIPNVGLRTPDDPAAEKQLTCKYCGHPEHGGYCENVKPVPSDKISISRSVAEEWHLFQWDRIQNGRGTEHDNILHMEIDKALKEQG